MLPMRRSRVLTIVLITLFVFSLVDLSGSYNPTADTSLIESPTDWNQTSEAGGTYVGIGFPLPVSFTGTFTNTSAWADSSTTLSSEFTPGTSYSVSNASSVLWTAYVLVSPPAEIESLSFTVDYNETEWTPISLTNPVGVEQSYLTDWWYETGIVQVSESAVTTYGVWKLEFTAMNHLFDLKLGNSSIGLSTTASFGLNDEMLYRATSTWITGASTEFILTDPTGTEWFSGTNTTTSNPNPIHAIQSMKYRKDFTINRNRHLTLDVNNFPVMIDITDSILETNVQNDADDIMFVSNGNILSHQIELFDQGTGHLIAWVKTNLTGSTNTVISMYYGNPLLGNMENPADVWTESFSAVWHLDEDTTAGQSSATHFDSTSGSYDGTQDGNYNDTGITGYGQHFDGSNDQVIISSSQSLEPSGDLEISGWFKLDSSHNPSSATTQLLFTKYLDGNTDMHIALVGSDYSSSIPRGSLVFKIENDDARMYRWTERTTWEAGQWWYFSCYMDSSDSSTNTIYIRAIDETNSTSSGSSYSANVTFSADWGIGGGLIDQVPGNLAWFDGVMDEVRISFLATGRSGAWRAAEWTNLNDPSTFYSIGAEIERTSPNLQIEKIVNNTALAGSWIATAFYKDSGSSVNYRVGMYERVFTVHQSSSLSLTAPTDAVGDDITRATIGDTLYIQVELTDDISLGGVEGAVVTTNWTNYGSKTNLQLHDEGGGLYGLSLNTSQLQRNIRWTLTIQSSLLYYTDALTTLYIDLTHDTVLDYSDVTQTHVGSSFNATLIYRDSYDGSFLAGATITFGDDSPVSFVDNSDGSYDISIPTGALPNGTYWYILNASIPGSLYEMASANITFVLRPHYTAASVSGNLITPYGVDTSLTVVLIDLATGELIDIGNVASFTFGSQVFNSPSSFEILLITDNWIVDSHDVTLTVVMSNTDYDDPTSYDFQIEIRKHLTSITVIGNLVTPYGNNTPLTIVITDLDTGDTLSSTDVASFLLDPASYSNHQELNPSDLDVNLDTSSWSVGTDTVTLSVEMSGNFENPSSYDFQITIRSMASYLYNEPSDLNFPNGDDFYIALRLNVSEIGPNYGDSIPGLLAGDFTITNGTYTFPATINDFGFGIYNLTIAASFFPQGTYTITVYVDPSNSIYASTHLVITFEYRPTRSDLTANIYTVSTPYEHDVVITLLYEDLDRSLGIITGEITSTDAPISPTHLGGGWFDVIIDVAGLSVGTHYIDLDADADGYTPKTVTITIIITRIHTDAEPSLISLDMPVGDSIIFSIDFNDLDNGIPISTATVTHNWTPSGNVLITWTGTTWEVNFTTTGSDTLETYVVWFNFDVAGPNYYPGYCEIEVIVRSHTTIFNLVSAVEPTAYNGIIHIELRYWDWDNNQGIETDTLVLSTVWNGTNWIANTLVNDGGGFYTIQIDAALFSQGVQNIDIYFNWDGLVQQYEDKMTTASVNIIGIDSQLTLMQSSEPTPYLDSMSYIFNYAEVGGAGITNDTYDVHIYVSFQGDIVVTGQVTITDWSATQPGNYSISFSTTIFETTGQIYMNVYINWTANVAPYYTNRFDVISVRILPRDTVLSVVPPSPTAYGENATFSFIFEDATGGASVPIDINSSLHISPSLVDYSISWNAGTHSFTISFDTSQFSAPLGQKSFTLDVEWFGSPYYNNRTGHTVFITVSSRQTVLDYQSPAPTAYLNNVTFLLNWTDIAGDPVVGISGATVTLYSGAFAIPSSHYTVTWITSGEYNVELNTTYYPNPDSYTLRVVISTGEFFISDVNSERPLNVLNRPTLLSAEPIGPAAFNSSLVYIIDFQDRLTFDVIDSDVTFEIINASWTFTSVWKPAFQYYELTIETYDQVGLTIGVEYSLLIRATYATQSPFYSSDDTYVFFELRNRASTLSVVDTPDPTAYNEIAEFRIYYRDTDASTGINANSITIFNGATPLVEGTDFIATNLGNGYYLISLNTSALDGLAYTEITVHALWTGDSPYHNDAEADVNIYVTMRETNIEITNPPTEAKYLDNVTFTFLFRDLGSGIPIDISELDIQIWSDGDPLTTVIDYTITKVGSSFTISINSTILSIGLVTNYNVTVYAIWPGGSPYYSNDATIVRVTTRNRNMAYAPLPAQEAAFGEYLNLTFSLLDADSDKPITNLHTLFSFDVSTGGLLEDTHFWITYEGTGIFKIRIDSVGLINPGTFTFDLLISWDGASPYYLNLAPREMTGIVTKIDTILIPVDELVEIEFGDSEAITLTYMSLLDSSLIDDAEIKWAWTEASITTGLGGFLGGGIYQVSIDASLADVGTYVISFTIENLTNYKSAVAYVTLVITPLDSSLIGVDPNIPVIQVFRGAELPITVYLQDGSSQAIPAGEVNEVTASIEGFQFNLFSNGTLGYYSVVLPSNNESATKRAPGYYTVILIAYMTNYDPATYSFQFLVKQTATEVQLIETPDEITLAYTQTTELRVNLILPDEGEIPFWNATVQWIITDLGISGNFTPLGTGHGNGTYVVTFDTTLVGYGIYPVTIRATPWLNESLYASSITFITVAITQIQTSLSPPIVRNYYWGWAGYLNFTYWDDSFGRGIDGANMTLEILGFEYTTFLYVGDGEYLVYLNTTLIRASTTEHILTARFSKDNHRDGVVSIEIQILEVPTELEILTPEINSDPVNYPGMLIVPFGDTLNITIFYNDTNDQEGFVGGLHGGNLTLNEIFGPTRGLTSFNIIEIGNGYYYFIFDTTDIWLFEQLAVGGPSPQLIPYTLTFRVALLNRELSSIDISVRIIELPTNFTIVESSEILLYGQTGRLVVIYEDMWPGHSPGTLISGANFTLDSETTQLYLLSVNEPYEDPTRPGYYIIEYTAASPIFGASSGISDLVISLSLSNAAGWTVSLRILTNPTPLAIFLTNAITTLVPILLLIAGFVIVYVRIWSVPKRLRQINGMIKTLRKGKVPKPITEAASRQALVADLFNDTYAKLEITRTPEQMPPESIPVDVPELGELIIQLAILTNLDQQELDEFKADIAKMKISEQAAFVKEVIMQEAIRAARRDHKTIEEIIADVEAQASKRIAGEGDAVVVEDGVEPVEVEPDVDTVILPDTDETTVPDTEVPSETVTDETIPSDRLSPFEIEELAKDLKAKGVPLHEIDTILKQARELPRDLVDELIRSLDREKRS